MQEEEVIILTQTVTGGKIQEDVPTVRTFVPRSHKMIAWIEKHANEIDNRKSGNLKISFRNESLQICEEVFHQVK